MAIPFRAVISDLDGTLLNAEHRIGAFTAQILAKLAKQGIELFFATGRNYPDVSHLIRQIDVQAATLVTANGARANYLSGELLVNHCLDEAVAARLMAVPFDPTKVCLNTYQGDEWFINRDIPQLKQYHQDSGLSYQVVDFSQHHSKQTEKVFYIARQAVDLLPIEAYIQQHFADQVQMTYSTPLCLEIMAKGVCKANTLMQLMAERGYRLQDCITFGDGMNDVEMLSLAGQGCLMENADPRLKLALPDHPIIGSHKDEAVAMHLKSVFELS